MIHALNGMFVMPVLGLLLLIVSFFAKVPGGVKWAGVVFGLVLLQVALGLLGHGIPALGGLHGLNALALFSAAIYAARRTRMDLAAPAVADTRVATTS
jgi:heme A synthase